MFPHQRSLAEFSGSVFQQAPLFCFCLIYMFFFRATNCEIVIDSARYVDMHIPIPISKRWSNPTTS